MRSVITVVSAILLTAAATCSHAQGQPPAKRGAESGCCTTGGYACGKASGKTGSEEARGGKFYGSCQRELGSRARQDCAAGSV